MAKLVNPPPDTDGVPVGAADAAADAAAAPCLRYTRGPRSLALGALALTRDEWAPVTEVALLRQALLPERVAEYGFVANPAALALLSSKGV